MFAAIFLLFSLIIPQPNLSEDFHEFHLSKCEIDYNEGEHALQISMHIFIDDLEEALGKEGKNKLYICTEKESEQAEGYIADYLSRHFRLQVDGQSVTYEFIGKEASEDLQGVWCYLEVVGIERIDRLNVSNDVLMEAFDDQKNIVSVTGPNKKQGHLLLMKGKSEEEITF